MLNSFVKYLLLITSIIFIPILVTQDFRFDNTVLNSSALNTFSLILGILIISRFKSFPQVQLATYVIPISFFSSGMIWLFILISRIQYSIKITLIGNLLLPILFLIFEYTIQKNTLQKLYFLPSKKAQSFPRKSNFVFIKLRSPRIYDLKLDGLIVDFRDEDLLKKWDRFLVNCALNKTPIYSYIKIKESLTGRVDLTSLGENDLGRLEPSKIVFLTKRIIDLSFILLISPFVTVLGIIIALCIYLETPDNVFFKQKRIGLNGDIFTMIKFRSMTLLHTKSNIKSETDRITKVGNFIRKYRLDEIPQFLNVIKGDMSLIGPRPELIELVEKYDKKIPFFMYRHIVRPGISGWAQVMLGYTVGVDQKKEKLAYDLYYIKHYSLWLDLLIWFKTIRTVFTGFGSR
jgi:lipopolysaccharide/colanic/teichoic acid biosynthesis glycosyltransferase